MNFSKDASVGQEQPWCFSILTHPWIPGNRLFSCAMNVVPKASGLGLLQTVPLSNQNTTMNHDFTSTGRDQAELINCPVRLQSLLFRRYSKSTRTHSCATRLGWTCFGRGVEVADLRKSLPTPNTVWPCEGTPWDCNERNSAIFCRQATALRPGTHRHLRGPVTGAKTSSSPAVRSREAAAAPQRGRSTFLRGWAPLGGNRAPPSAASVRRDPPPGPSAGLRGWARPAPALRGAGRSGGRGTCNNNNNNNNNSPPKLRSDCWEGC